MAKEVKRSKKITARFTEEELKIVTEMERALGMTKTELVRSRLLNTGTRITIDAKAMLKELNVIGTELGRSGNNINQLARHANRLHKRGMLAPALIEQFNSLFSGYLDNQQKLELVIRKVLRSMIS